MIDQAFTNKKQIFEFFALAKPAQRQEQFASLLLYSVVDIHVSEHCGVRVANERVFYVYLMAYTMAVSWKIMTNACKFLNSCKWADFALVHDDPTFDGLVWKGVLNRGVFHTCTPFGVDEVCLEDYNQWGILKNLVWDVGVEPPEFVEHESHQ
jgi:hypothetical protein